MANERQRLIAITLDEASIGRGNPDQEHERAIAIYDIVEANYFALPDTMAALMRFMSGWWTTSFVSRSVPATAPR